MTHNTGLHEIVEILAPKLLPVIAELTDLGEAYNSSDQSNCQLRIKIRSSLGLVVPGSVVLNAIFLAFIFLL